MAWVAQREYRVCTATLKVSLEDFDSGTTYLERLLGGEHDEFLTGRGKSCFLPEL